MNAMTTPPKASLRDGRRGVAAHELLASCELSHQDLLDIVCVAEHRRRRHLATLLGRPLIRRPPLNAPNRR